MVKLTDLNPHWVSALGVPAGTKLGIRFDSPINREDKIAVFFKNPVCGSPAVDLEELLRVQCDCDHPKYEQWLHDHHIGSCLWQRTGDSFENLTLTPSIDCSKWGGWHGYLTNGQVS